MIEETYSGQSSNEAEQVRSVHCSHSAELTAQTTDGNGPSTSAEQLNKPTYYTASDMMSTMSKALQEFSGEGSADEGRPQVELHKRMPDGTTVPVDEKMMKATDVQMKLKQVWNERRCLKNQLYHLLRIDILAREISRPL